MRRWLRRARKASAQVSHNPERVFRWNARNRQMLRRNTSNSNGFSELCVIRDLCITAHCAILSSSLCCREVCAKRCIGAAPSAFSVAHTFFPSLLHYSFPRWSNYTQTDAVSLFHAQIAINFHLRLQSLTGPRDPSQPTVDYRHARLTFERPQNHNSKSNLGTDDTFRMANKMCNKYIPEWHFLSGGLTVKLEQKALSSIRGLDTILRVVFSCKEAHKKATHNRHENRSG